MALHETGFYRPQNGGFYTSGPNPIAEDKLYDYIADLPVLGADLPRSAEAFVLDIKDATNAILGQVTGGSMPSITCEVEYGTL
jgi:hypothetical protein